MPINSLLFNEFSRDVQNYQNMILDKFRLFQPNRKLHFPTMEFWM